MAPERGLRAGDWVHTGVGIPNRGYTRVFEYDQAFGSPIGATHRCLESQPGLHTGVWIPAGATHGCLESKPGLHTGVWSPKRAIVQVAICKCEGSLPASGRRPTAVLVSADGHAGSWPDGSWDLRDLIF